MSAEDFRHFGHQVVDWIADYLEHIDELPVLAQVEPGDLKAKLPASPPEKGESMETILADSIARQRFSMLLLAIFAGVALTLAAVGIYGVMSYSVAQRTNEIGIRLALGAQTRDVVLMIVKQGGMLIVLGLVIGLAGAYAITRLITSWLFGVTAKDPFTFAAVALLLGLVALLSPNKAWVANGRKALFLK